MNVDDFKTVSLHIIEEIWPKALVEEIDHYDDMESAILITRSPGDLITWVYSKNPHLGWSLTIDQFTIKPYTETISRRRVFKGNPMISLRDLDGMPYDEVDLVTLRAICKSIINIGEEVETQIY